MINTRKINLKVSKKTSAQSHKVLILPVGVSLEVMKGVYSLLEKNDTILAVFLEDGVMMSKKKQVLEILGKSCELAGLNYHTIGVSPSFEDLIKVVKKLEEIAPTQVLVGTFSGPRILSLLLLKLVHDWCSLRNIEPYIVLALEGGENMYVQSLHAYFTTPQNLTNREKTVLEILLKTGETETENLKKTTKVKWAVYRTLRNLKEKGLIESPKRGRIKLTFLGKILAVIIHETS